MALVVALYVDFIRQALGEASVFGLSPLDVLLIALPPAQLAFMVGGSVATKMSGRTWFAFKWAAVTLAWSVLLDCLLFLYYQVGRCLAIC